MKQFSFSRYMARIMVMIALFLFALHSSAQTVPDTSRKQILCGSTAEYMLKRAYAPSGGTSTPRAVTPFPASAVDTCGKIDVYYEDVRRHFQIGFDDTTATGHPGIGYLPGGMTFGEVRRNTLRAVLMHIQSVFNFDNVPAGNHIRLYVDTSFNQYTHRIRYPLSIAARSFPAYDSTADGIINGWFADYVNGNPSVGTDPAPGQFHGVLQVNFDQTFVYHPLSMTLDSFAISWHDDYLYNYNYCGQVDLFSILMHEVTHCMGWWSLISFPGGGGTYDVSVPPTPQIATHHLFTGLDWSYRVGNNAYPLSLTKLLGGTRTSPTLDVTNPLFPCKNNYWLGDSAAPNNHPVYSGGYGNGVANSYLSHLDDQQLAYTFRQRISPGDQQDYVMGPFAEEGVWNRNYSKGEIQAIVNILGYRLTDSFAAHDTDVYRNHLPYSRKMGRLPFSIDTHNYGYYAEEVTHDDTLTNNIGASYTISIPAMIAAGDVTDTDAVDIPYIHIDSATLVNFRGGGIGGNNHLCLHVSTDGKYITYTPRPGFYGRMQCGFNLHDGRERGGFVVMTIDVLKGTNVTATPGANMVCNPGFEEGSETRLNIPGPEELIPNTIIEKGLHEGKLQGIQFSDSHPYGYISNFGFRTLNSGTIINNCALDECDSLSTFAFGSLDFTTMDTSWNDNPAPMPGSGNRYQQFLQPGCSYYNLTDTVKHCKRYALEFDMYREELLVYTVIDTIQMKIGVADHIVDVRTVLPDTEMNYLFNVSIPATTHDWVHKRITFYDCGLRPSTYLFIESPTGYPFDIDNLSLKEIADTPLVVTATAGPVIGCTRTLTAHVANTACDTSYLWSTSATDSTIIVPSYVTATYTITVHDGCRTGFTTITVTDIPPAPITGPSAVCSGSAIVLSDTTAGGTWNSSNIAIATVDSTGRVTGINAGTVSITYTHCFDIVTYRLTVNPLPALITGTEVVCIGATTLLHDATSGGHWSSNNPAVATISLTGTVTGASADTTTMEYTISSTGCAVSVVVTVNPLPGPISGPAVICAGSSATLTDTYFGGVWTSSNVSVATIDAGSGIVTGVTTGTARITYTAATGCLTTETITVNPAVPAITGIDSLCAGTTTALHDAAAGGFWSSDSTSIATIGSSGIVTGVSGGTDVIRYTITPGCYAVTTVTVKTVPVLGPITFSGPGPAFCSGQSAIADYLWSLYSLDPATGDGIWTVSTPGVGLILGTYGDFTVIEGLSPGTDTLTYSVVNSCGTGSASVVLTVNTTPAAITGRHALCIGSLDTLADATAGGSWSSSNPAVGSVDSLTGIVTGISPGATGIAYTSASGCSVGFLVTVDSLLAPIAGTAFACVGSTSLLSDATTDGTWNSSDLFVASADPSSGLITGMSAGVATISYSNACGTVTRLFTVNALPATIIGIRHICIGSPVTFSDATSGGSWRSSNIGVATVSPAGIVTGITAGTATITYSISATGCYATADITVDIAPAIIIGFSNVCTGSVITLTDATPGGTWASSSTAIATVSTSGVVTGISTGTVTISYTLPGGCFKTRTVFVHATPSAITGSTSICIGTTSTLGSLPSGGIWSSGNSLVATIDSVTGLVTGISPGIDTISYRLSTGCRVTTVVIINPSPAPITGTPSLCIGGTTTLHDSGSGHWTSGTTAIAIIGLSSGIVTGISAGSAIITYTSGAGCFSVITVTVTTGPPAITGTMSICIGNTTTLSDATSGGHWSSSPASVATIGTASGIVTAISAGTATITYMLPSGCYSTARVTVNASPAAIRGTLSLCLGATSTLGDDSTGGTWTSSNPAIVLIDPIFGTTLGMSVGTATITYTLSTGCRVTTVVTVNPLPSPITGLTSLCSHGTDTLSDATPGGTWSISPAGVASIGASTGVLSGIAADTATVSYTLPDGCAVSVAVTVNADTGGCSLCSVMSRPFSFITGPTISTSLAPGNYYLDHDVTIMGVVAFINALIVIAPGKTITVDQNATLTISGSHLMSTCNMWNGIVLGTDAISHSATLYIQDHSLIEDALTAVYINKPVTPAVGYFLLLSDNAIFNRNINGIDIENYNAEGITYPIQIGNTVFMSRNLQPTMPSSTPYPYYWPQTTGTNGLKTAWTAPTVFDPPFNLYNNVGSPTSGPFISVTCKNNHAAAIGIKLGNTGSETTNNAGIPLTYAEIVIGDEIPTANNRNQNMFDGLAYGVYGVNSNFSCINNVFTGMSPVESGMPPSWIAGDGVYANVTNDIQYRKRMRVFTPPGTTYNNIFYGFRTGVECYNYFEMYGDHAYMMNANRGNKMYNNMGMYGYYVTTAKFDTIDISADTITNVNTGIAVWEKNDGTTAPGTLSQIQGYVAVDNNIVQAHPSGFSAITTQFVNQGIVVQDMIGSRLGYAVVTLNNAHVNYNKINDAYDGIFLNNLRRQQPAAVGNTIYVRPYTTGRPPMQYGINYTNCIQGKEGNNFVSGSLGTVDSTSDSMKAYYAASNNMLTVACNTENNMGRGYEFFLQNPKTHWNSNTIQNNLRGMVLNHGVIGSQGAWGYPSNNQWLPAGGWAPGTFQTWEINSNTLSDTLFVLNSLATLPAPAHNSGDPVLLKYVLGSHGLETTALDGTESIPCGVVPVIDSSRHPMRLFEIMAQQEVPYSDNIVPNNWMGQFKIWEGLQLDSTLADSSTVLQRFDSLASNSRYALITNIENYIGQNNYPDALTLINSGRDSVPNGDSDIVTNVRMADGPDATYIVENYMSYYRLYIKFMSDSLTGSDSLSIMALAQLCPEQNGSVVYQARALYSLVYDDLSVFNDDSCSSIDSDYIAARHSTSNGSNKIGISQLYKLYPNPNDGNLTLMQTIPDSKPASIEITDVVGRSIYKETISFGGGKYNVQLGNIVPGMYLLSLKDSFGKEFRFKFVVQ